MAAAAAPAALPAAAAAPDSEEEALAATGAGSGQASALAAAFRGGAAAAAAQVVTVPLFMWVHTVMYYQHRYGGGVVDVARKLYAEGGVRRFHRGLVPVLLHVPLSRFGGIAATDGAFAAMGSTSLPVSVAAGVASVGAAVCRGALMPLSVWSTVSQVEGREGMRRLLTQVRASPGSLWRGTGGAMATTCLGHWTWCVAHRRLHGDLPELAGPCGGQLRHAIVGFLSTAVSDVCTNGFRVLTTVQQTASEPMGYLACARKVVREDGFAGFVGRGLKARILASGLQGAIFTVGWQAFADRIIA